MKLFIILGNQLFSPQYLKKFKDHTFFMAEDYDLCTYEKHHKLKILLFLSSMRSFRDELKSNNFKVHYEDVNSKFKTSYEKKIEKIIKDKKIKEVSFFEIEDKFFEKKIFNFCKKKSLKANQIKTPMFLIDRNEFKDYLSKNKRACLCFCSDGDFDCLYHLSCVPCSVLKAEFLDPPRREP